MDEINVMNGTTEWVQSASNTVVSFRNPDPSAFDINDIALALSRQPRYNGHGRFFYSVAQHSIYAAMLASKDAKIYALMHDAHEAYTGDIPGPLKELLGQRVLRVESKLENAIYRGLGINPDPNTQIQDEVNSIDKSLLEPECAALFTKRMWKINGVLPAKIPVNEWPMEDARYWFLAYYFSIRSTNRNAVWMAEQAIKEVNNAHAEPG